MSSKKKQKQKKKLESQLSELLLRLEGHLSFIYPNEDLSRLTSQSLAVMGLDRVQKKPRWHKNKWDEADIALITYANSVIRKDELPLVTLEKFLDKELDHCITWLHILPFFPYSSDDGFAVIDYLKVNESYGDWSHISRLGDQFKLMADLVINH